MQIDPTLAALVVTNVAGPAVAWALARRRNNAAAVKDEADAAESLSVTVSRLVGELNALYPRLSAAESRASSAESRLSSAEARTAAAEARTAAAEADVARLRGEVAGLRVELEQHAANEKRLLEQLSAASSSGSQAGAASVPGASQHHTEQVF